MTSSSFVSFRFVATALATRLISLFSVMQLVVNSLLIRPIHAILRLGLNGRWIFKRRKQERRASRHALSLVISSWFWSCFCCGTRGAAGACGFDFRTRMRGVWWRNELNVELVVQKAWRLMKDAGFTRSRVVRQGEVRVLGGQGPAGNVDDGLLPLNAISDNKGSRKDRTRIGRGIGSGKGKTSGKGHKGQKARSGHKPRLGFEGGQTPLRLRIPKRGFTNTLGLAYQPVNLNTIADLVNNGRIDTSQLITMKTLKDAGAVGKKMRDGMKLLGRGAEDFSVPIHIEVSRVSERAKSAIEAAGGSVRRVHYNQLGLRALLDPDWFSRKGRLLPQPARPPLKFLSKVDGTGRLPVPSTPVASPTSTGLESSSPAE